MALLKFIFLFFILALVVIAWIAYKFFKQLHRVARRFQPRDNDYNGQARTSSHRAMRQADGNTIVDQRSDKQRNKKIIKDDEGEYIDYK